MMLCEAPSYDKILWRRWLWAEITSNVVIPVAVLAFHSSTQKVGVMMYIYNKRCYC